MHRVATEIAQEIAVLLQDNHPDPGAGQQKRVNQACGPASGDADLGLQDTRHCPTLPGASRLRENESASTAEAFNGVAELLRGSPHRCCDRPRDLVESAGRRRSG